MLRSRPYHFILTTGEIFFLPSFSLPKLGVRWICKGIVLFFPVLTVLHNLNSRLAWRHSHHCVCICVLIFREYGSSHAQYSFPLNDINQFCRSEVWAGWTGSSALGLARPKMRCQLSWALVLKPVRQREGDVLIADPVPSSRECKVPAPVLPASQEPLPAPSGHGIPCPVVLSISSKLSESPSASVFLFCCISSDPGQNPYPKVSRSVTLITYAKSLLPYNDQPELCVIQRAKIVRTKFLLTIT